ncbi:MAG: NAD(P)H-dependent glycerol-3-phosphate dehydrogenase [Actinobacteria bacterium]|nr:MAG: NAD(P)H-dependent glycerol-3-phosphate dehydrogenase [Actinomycetota bacterium]TML66465.1 MAG: NAD(P)H-dependent glycerol-3-phosphate dehydrogenase [Actinomycetota bacterium]
MKVAVLGAGSWGTTVATLACGRNKTLLWARDPEVAREVNEDHANSSYLAGFALPTSLRATADLEEAVCDADVLIVGVPSHGFRTVLDDARVYVRPWIPVVSLTKGLEQGTLLRMTQIINELLPGHPAAALTGPNLAREIMAGQAAASVIATEDLTVAAALQAVLRRGLFRIYTNHDVIGCEVGGALKNVIAIATGMAQGVGVGDNTRAAVVTRGLAELTRLGVAMGGEPATFAGLAGMGDLIATCISPHSRNRYVGEQLGLGRPLDEILAEMNMVAEGVKTSVTVMQLGDRYDVAMPICEEIHKVVTGVIKPADAYRGLAMPAGHEAEPG